VNTPSSRPDARTVQNLFAFGSDTILFGIGFLGFLSPDLILPALSSKLVGSTAAVGSLITALSVAWSLPQLVAGNLVGRLVRKKRFVMTMALVGRTFILGLAALIAFTRADPPWLSMAGLYLAFFLFLGTDGFATIGWMDMLARAFPPEKRGAYISYWQAISSAGLFVAGIVVSFILSSAGPPFPYNYALIIAIGGVLLFLASIGTANIQEVDTTEDPLKSQMIPLRSMGTHIADILRQEPRLVQFILARVTYSLGTMAGSLYGLYAIGQLGFPEARIGSFGIYRTIGTVIAALVLGRVADLYGTERAIKGGTAVVITAPMLAFVMSVFHGQLSSLVLDMMFIWIYVCSGLANNLLFLGFANYLLELAPRGQRTIYTGTVNSINTIGVFGPWLAGLIVDLVSYQAMFAVSMVLALVSLMLASRLPSLRPRIVSS
jgi:MFS family permease